MWDGLCKCPSENIEGPAQRLEEQVRWGSIERNVPPAELKGTIRLFSAEAQNTMKVLR